MRLSLHIMENHMRWLLAVFATLVSAPASAADLSCENTDIIKKYACLIMQEAKGEIGRAHV